MSEATFKDLIRQIKPNITSHEINILFGYVDVKKEMWVPLNVIEEKVFNIDYRDSGDVLSRKLDEIVAILHARHEHP